MHIYDTQTCIKVKHSYTQINKIFLKEFIIFLDLHLLYDTKAHENMWQLMVFKDLIVQIRERGELLKSEKYVELNLILISWQILIS